jgi:hypothetical protein
MAAGQAKTERLQVMLALKTHAYLELLAQKGTHGVSRPDVAKGLIERGIQSAIADGILTPEDVNVVQSRK